MKKKERLEDHVKQSNVARRQGIALKIYVSRQVHRIGIVACFIRGIDKIGISIPTT